MKKHRISVLAGVAVLIFGFSTCQLVAQSPATGTPQVGYAVISQGSGTSSSTPKLQVSQTFGFQLGNVLLQTETAPAQMTTSALIFINTSATQGRNTGIAIANPGDTTVQIDMTLRRNDGIIVALKTIFVGPRQQISQFVTQMFADQLTLPSELTGTLSLIANSPVAILAERFRGQSFSTETLSGLSGAFPIPQITPGISTSGPIFFLPNFVVGGGWTTEITIINTDTSQATVRLDLFTASGAPMRAILNGTTGNVFTGLVVQPGGVLVITPAASGF